MKRFFVEENQIKDTTVTITGTDVNHINNVLRMKKNDKILISTGQGEEFYCIIDKICDNYIIAEIVAEEVLNTELSTRIYLFQGVPKLDKMELIIQKAVELGAYEIIPVDTKRTVVKLDEKKKATKLNRWQSISESAAKQSGRAIIPSIKEVLSFKEAIEYSKELEYNIIPYEKIEGMKTARDIIDNIGLYKSIGIFIGPEGGFDEVEIRKATENNIIPISLGRRILRTETAGMAILSVIMFGLEAY